MSLFGISNFGLFFAAVLLLNAAPGPDTAYIVGRSVAQGRNAGLMFIPQFVRTDAPQKIVAFLLLGVMFAAINMCWNSGTAFLAGMLARQARRNPKLRLWLERMVGSAFIALGAKLALTRN